MTVPQRKLRRLAVARALAGLVVDACATPEKMPAHRLIARTRSVLAWMEAGAPPKAADADRPEASAAVVEVFEHWRRVMRKTASVKLTRDRERLIAARLAEGATVETCKRAIDGCRHSPHHRGENRTETVYDSIALIFRSADKLDWFAAQAPKRRPVLAPVVKCEPPAESPATAEEIEGMLASLSSRSAVGSA